MVNFKEIYHFFKVPEGVQHIPGGVQLFPGGSNCLFPIETHITCDFPGGVVTPCPPSGSALGNSIIKVTGKMTSFLPIIGMVVSISAQTRKRHNRVLQLMVSLIMWIGGCKRKVSIRERESSLKILQYQNIDNNVANQMLMEHGCPRPGSLYEGKSLPHMT